MTSFEQLSGKARQTISSALEPEEEIATAIAGSAGSAMVATNRRVLVFKKGVTTGALTGRQLNTWDYSNVSGVEVKHTITTRALVLQAPGVVPVTKFGTFAKGPSSVWEAANAIMLSGSYAHGGAELDEAVATLRRLIADHQTREAPPQDPIDQVKRLAELRDQGVVTEEEFQSMKRRLLGL